jgi:hypothetical protein
MSSTHEILHFTEKGSNFSNNSEELNRRNMIRYSRRYCFHHQELSKVSQRKVTWALKDGKDKKVLSI